VPTLSFYGVTQRDADKEKVREFLTSQDPRYPMLMRGMCFEDRWGHRAPSSSKP